MTQEPSLPFIASVESGEHGSLDHAGVVAVQFFRARVAFGSEAPTEHLVLDAHHPTLADDIVDGMVAALAARHPVAILCVIVECATGCSRVRHGGTASPLAIAAAVATWMRGGGWDESDPLVVGVDGRSVAVRLRFESDRYQATLTETVALREYRDLMGAFVRGDMAATEFETRFLRLFKRDDTLRGTEVFEILDRLFGDVDAFSDDPALRGPDGLDEPALRARATAALQALG